MKHTRFPRARRLRKGYHRRQVDAFLDHIDVALSGALPPPTAAEVRRAGFELVRRGYDTVAVDSALDALEERVLAAQEQAAGRRGKKDPGSEIAFLTGELTAPYMKRFPRAGTFRRGYSIDDVDDFVDHLVAGLDVAGTPPRVEDVRVVPFRPQRGGYREDAVDEMLDRVVELLLVLRSGKGHDRI
jgi:DivIVA domain-containing protein